VASRPLAESPDRPLPTTPAEKVDATRILTACLEAVADLDKERLVDLLARSSMELSAPYLRSQVLIPLLREIGERWRDGSMRIAQEHLASVVVRSHLGTLRVGNLPPDAAPRIVVSTPAGQLHEFGALMAAATAMENGWEVVYLGPNPPAEEIAAAAKQRDAQAVALSIIYPGADPRLHEEFRRLREFLGEGVPILVGGRSASAFLDVFSEIGAIYLEDLDILQNQLEQLAG